MTFYDAVREGGRSGRAFLLKEMKFRRRKSRQEERSVGLRRLDGLRRFDSRRDLPDFVRRKVAEGRLRAPIAAVSAARFSCGKAPGRWVERRRSAL
jgi:hypothetical protein